MRKRDHKALAAYVRVVADLMELRDWTVTLSDQPCDPAKRAEVFIPYGHRHARISVAQNFRHESAEHQRESIVHELVHCHIEVMVDTVERDLADHLGRQSDSLFWRGYKRQMELSVDALARTVAPHMPPIDWPA